MDLGVTVVARGDAVRCLGLKNLLGLKATVLPTRFRQSRLQETTPTAATIIIRPVGGHVDKVLLPDHGPNHIAKVFSYRVAEGFADELAGILNSKLNLSFLVPIGADF